MKKYLCVLLAVAICTGAAWAQDNGGSATADSAGADPGSTNPEYRIGPGDVLSIAVWREPDLTIEAPVRPDGKIGVPFLNDVQASGLTPTELQKNITEGLAKFLNNPQVSVIVVQIRSMMVYVSGAVNRPGVYPLNGTMTVMNMLVEAGGLAEFADREKIQILRKENGKQTRYIFNYKAFLEGRDYEQNIILRSGDLIIVPD